MAATERRITDHIEREQPGEAVRERDECAEDERKEEPFLHPYSASQER